MTSSIDDEYRITAPDPMLPANGPTNSAELGVLLADVGMSTLEARAFIEQVQALSTHTALAAAPKLLEHVRKIQQARLQGLYRDVSALPQYRLGRLVTVPYISRDRVLEAIMYQMQTVPRI